MPNFIKQKNNYYKTFFELYNEIYFHRIAAIDIALKTNVKDLNEKEIAALLYISETDVKQIMKKLDIKEINLVTFFQILVSGSSDICDIIKRELQCNNPLIYSLKDISYIYQLDLKILEEAACLYGKHEIPSKELQSFFKCVKLRASFYTYQ